MSKDNVLSTLTNRIDGARDMITSTLMFYEHFFGDERIVDDILNPLQATAEQWTKDACEMFAESTQAKPNPRYIMEGFYRHLLILLLTRIMVFNGDNRDELIVFCMAVLQSPSANEENPDTRH